MAEIIYFLAKHWILTGAVTIIFFLICCNELRLQRILACQLDAQEVIRMMNHHQAVVLDIRDADHFKAGHIVGARTMPATHLLEKISSINNYKTKAIVLICEKGNAAPSFAQQLKAAGCEHIYCLAGGMLAWQKENLPLNRV